MVAFPVHMQAIIFANSLKEYEIITSQGEWFILAQCLLGNFQYGGDHNMWNVCIFSLKEYEIITLIYNRKTCR